mgnify:CR=1 FL=1
MRHRKYTFKIGRNPGHRNATMANLACSLFEYGQIKTTVPKAKELRRFADKMITLGKKGTVHARRRALSKLRQRDIVNILFDDIAPEYADRQGGYSRIMRLGQRRGDGAELCLIELVEESVAADESDIAGDEEVEPEEESVEAGSDEDSETANEEEAEARK